MKRPRRKRDGEAHRAAELADGEPRGAYASSRGRERKRGGSPLVCAAALRASTTVTSWSSPSATRRAGTVNRPYSQITISRGPSLVVLEGLAAAPIFLTVLVKSPLTMHRPSHSARAALLREQPHGEAVGGRRPSSCQASSSQDARSFTPAGWHDRVGRAPSEPARLVCATTGDGRQGLVSADAMGQLE